MTDEQVNDTNSAIKEGFVMGLEQALELAVLHKQYSNDIDYLIASLKKQINNQKPVKL